MPVFLLYRGFSRGCESVTCPSRYSENTVNVPFGKMYNYMMINCMHVFAPERIWLEVELMVMNSTVPLQLSNPEKTSCRMHTSLYMFMYIV